MDAETVAECTTRVQVRGCRLTCYGSSDRAIGFSVQDVNCNLLEWKHRILGAERPGPQLKCVIGRYALIFVNRLKHAPCKFCPFGHRTLGFLCEQPDGGKSGY
jgi:hypothetical protein